MTIKEYQKSTHRTNAPLSDTYSQMVALHMVLGLMTEAGEIADVYKKNLAYGKSLDLINIKEEIGDLMWYISELCNYHGWDLENILETNIEKLKARFPEKFSAQHAIERDLVTERIILENRTTF
jgi:NTP pyrophosphatase (non-canonical NTP hydrolase)